MSDATVILTGITNPRQASHGERPERLVAVWYVGILTGLMTVMAAYVYHRPGFAISWATDTVALGTIFTAGVLIKWLVGWMRASITAYLLSFFVSVIGLLVVKVAPYYLLGIPTGGPVLYIPLRDGISLLIMVQCPLHAIGFLTATLYEAFKFDI